MVYTNYKGGLFIKSNILYERRFEMKKWIKPILVILAIVMLFIGANSIFIYKYLSEYGYGIKELPQTVAVWLRLSDGFTVEVNDDGDDSSTLFIGHSDLLYYLRKYENKGYG